LRELERSGIEIDVCPVCRGIWLDRGELDKLIDRESRDSREDADDDWDDEPRQRGNGGRPQKKRGFFQNLMDSFGEGGMGD
jgi:Zn-finger nucleic acid-binding protein